MELEAGLSAILLNAFPATIFIYDLEQQRTVFVNRRIHDLLGFSPDEVIAMGPRLFSQVAHPDELPRVFASLERLATLPPGASQLLEYQVKHRQGEWRRVVTWSTPFQRSEDGRARTILVVALDAEVQARAIGTVLTENESKYQAIFHHAPIMMCITSFEDGRCLAVNERFLQVTGYTRDEVIGQTTTGMGWYSMEDRNVVMEKLRQRGSIEGVEVQWRNRSGNTMTFEFSGEVITVENQPLLLNFGRDITAEKNTRRERQTMIDLLRMINLANDREELLRRVLVYVREHFGCDAVGIRLRQEYDYPYFETTGFSDDFIRAENRLCQADETGKPVFGPDGNPVIECMCGNILQGRFDPTQPMFTANGSFWTNSTTELLATTTETERQARTRNRCNGEGYESVALIPLRSGGVTFGLIQLNDRKKGRFSPESIDLLEQLADQVATYLAKSEAESARRASEDKYRKLFEMESDALFLIDGEDGRILEANQAAERLYGYSRGELLTMTNLDLSKEPEETKRAMTSQLEMIPLRYHRRKDGSVFATEITARHHVWRGKPVIICAIRDISGRLQAEEVLADRERMFATLISNLPGFIYRCQNDQNWTMIYISDGCLNVTGYHPDEFIENRSIAFNDIVHPDHQTALWNRWQENLRKRAVFEEEYPIVTKSGETRWVWERGRGVFDENGDVRFLEGFITDVTERRRGDELLRASEARLREAEKNAHIGNWEWVRLSGELYCSEEACRIAGLAGDEPITLMSLRHVLEHNDLASIRGEIFRCIREKRNLGIDIYIRRPDGSRRAVNVQGILRIDRTGQIESIVGTIQDVTERKAVEQTLRDREQKLTEQNALLEQKTAALRELIDQIKAGRSEVDHHVGAKINEIIFPLLHRAKENISSSSLRSILNTLDNSLHDIAQSLEVGIGEQISSLSRREKEISYLVREGMSSKEIAETLGISYRSVTTHRRNIRKKLGLVSKKVDLGAHLSGGK